MTLWLRAIFICIALSKMILHETKVPYLYVILERNFRSHPLTDFPLPFEIFGQEQQLPLATVCCSESPGTETRGQRSEARSLR